MKQTTELEKKHAVLEERMNTSYERMNAAFERLRTDMAKRDTDMAKRDKDNLRWQIGLWVAAIVILGFIIRFPSVPSVTN